MKVVQSNRTVALGKRKIQDVTSKFTDVVSVVLTESQVAENTDVCDNCMKLVYSIKKKLKDKPEKRARKLKKEKGILATLKNYSREGINRATKLLITELYECDAVYILEKGIV